ncbi:GNAT family N-acetyltransferase [Aureimonas pseudogalii]|uniref:Ribosomal protein S18 acetylase RimI-like enzyme n=1 Tax=Aureimonas pseudogalii TaxID=1744844 RepID=A0A7W6EA94_9HYPH|nr:GNAT family N-acetyltransferase [Aureimonas pseudogalii]MBB3997598.1 ribosomal protein S18 acetylase RimI-like enzyme [Aureimonas pseudogalii]
MPPVPPPHCRLRPAEAGDLDAVAALWHASASLPGVGPATLLPVAAMRERLERQQERGWRLTVAAVGPDLLGFSAIDPAEGVLAELFVRPASLRGGIGRRLLDGAKAAMPGGFTLFTREANAGARRFYEREGLAATGRGTHPRSGDPVIHYAWRPGRT